MNTAIKSTLSATDGNNSLPAVVAGMQKASLRPQWDERSNNQNVADGGQPAKAVAYVRMSTEHQQYSTVNQLAVIKEYATKNNMEIVRVYSDDGKSGLVAKRRNCLLKLLEDAQNQERDFANVLVYDVSRWGRYQNPDEAASYEFKCAEAGVAFHYCAEDFRNDGSVSSNIVKMVKRVMAREYSRELSGKVFLGACNLIRLGFKQGGPAGYGLRRMLIDQAGKRKGILQAGEMKSIQTDRVILVPGPDEEVRRVRWIYDAFHYERKSESEIAAILNRENVMTDFQRPWTRGVVHEILTNEKYVGHNVYNRTSFKLKARHVKNPREEWIRSDHAFKGIIDADLFYTVQGMILQRSRKLSDEAMLEKLRTVLEKHGRISGILIDERDDMPSSTAFRHRFGSLVRAYQLVGYNPPLDYGFIETNKELRKKHADLMDSVINSLRGMGIRLEHNAGKDLLTISGELKVSIVLCRHQTTGSGASRWLIRLDASLEPDITIAVRMDATNQNIRDYYLLPSIDMTEQKIRIAEKNGIFLDAYCVDSLERFFHLTERVAIREES
jgi:DNA invertase Pin-like site-specific DNA recombinase